MRTACGASPVPSTLYAGTPNQYEIALPLRPNGPLAHFSVNQLGFYAQDIWSVTPRLSLTYGVRVDDPLLPNKPDANVPLAAIQFTHVDLGVTGSTDRANTADISTSALFSPRFGFNYDVGNGDQTTLFAAASASSPAGRRTSGCRTPSPTPGCTQATLTCNGAADPHVHDRPDVPADHLCRRWRTQPADRRRSSISITASSSRRRCGWPSALTTSCRGA